MQTATASHSQNKEKNKIPAFSPGVISPRSGSLKFKSHDNAPKGSDNINVDAEVNESHTKIVSSNLGKNKELKGQSSPIEKLTTIPTERKNSPSHFLSVAPIIKKIENLNPFSKLKVKTNSTRPSSPLSPPRQDSLKSDKKPSLKIKTTEQLASSPITTPPYFSVEESSATPSPKPSIKNLSPISKRRFVPTHKRSLTTTPNSASKCHSQLSYIFETSPEEKLFDNLAKIDVSSLDSPSQTQSSISKSPISSAGGKPSFHKRSKSEGKCVNARSIGQKSQMWSTDIFYRIQNCPAQILRLRSPICHHSAVQEVLSGMKMEFFVFSDLILIATQNENKKDHLTPLLKFHNLHEVSRVTYVAMNPRVLLLNIAPSTENFTPTLYQVEFDSIAKKEGFLKSMKSTKH